MNKNDNMIKIITKRLNAAKEKSGEKTKRKKMIKFLNTEKVITK